MRGDYVFFKKKMIDPVEIDLDNIPAHVGVIMDGNGRWAKKRGLPRQMGHKEGSKTVRLISLYANKIGVKALTVYAFSTENWSRPADEVNYLMKLPKEFFDSFLPEVLANNIKVTFIGDVEALNDEVRNMIYDVCNQSKDNTGLVLNIAINYGSQQEIIRAAQKLAVDVANGNYNPEDINKEMFESKLETNELGPVDLLIRTSGELRISNYLLYQIAYAELYFTDVYWPDFNEIELDKAILDYQKRNRRFGGLK